MLCHYEELKDLFSNLSPKSRLRIICHFILCLPAERIASLENCSDEIIYQTFRRANKKLKQVHDHNEMVSVLQEIFAPKS